MKNVAVVGLGFVGLTLSVVAAKKYIGEFEFISLEKGLNEMIESYRKN